MERLNKLRLTTMLERRMRSDLKETIKIMEFLFTVDIFFKYFSSNWTFTVKADFKN